MQLFPDTSRDNCAIRIADISSRLGLRARGINRFDVSEKPVAAARDRLDEARALGGVAERIPNLINCFVEAVIKINNRPRLEPASQLLPAHQFSGFCQQYRENLEGLLL
jgi:hypothetical protein